ncbi:MAG: LysR family transcriptional regulator [Inquilinaceae bacterium]
MNTLDLEIFVRVVATQNLSAAGRDLGLSPAVVSKRLAGLEDRLGARLLQRTTRRVTVTEEGAGFHERAVRILADLEEAEASLSNRRLAPRGTLRVTTPAAFGRQHLSPAMPDYLARYPEVQLDLNLTDSFIDIIDQGFDLAVRIDEPKDSTLVARRLAPNRRVICAAPAYLARHGTPRVLEDLADHNCLALDHQPVWTFEDAGVERRIRVSGNLRTNNGEVLRDAAVAGLGIALKSTWDVGAYLQSGALVTLLTGYGVSTRLALYAVYPSARLLSPKVRTFVDFLAARFGPEPYWDRGLTLGRGKT